jgi:hypothetical protein
MLSGTIPSQAGSGLVSLKHFIISCIGMQADVVLFANMNPHSFL